MDKMLNQFLRENTNASKKRKQRKQQEEDWGF